jgi:hypothetical protein
VWCINLRREEKRGEERKGEKKRKESWDLCSVSQHKKRGKKKKDEERRGEKKENILLESHTHLSLLLSLSISV